MDTKYTISKIYDINEDIEVQNYVAMTSLFCIGEMIDTNNIENMKDEYQYAMDILGLAKFDTKENYQIVIQVAKNFVDNYYNRGYQNEK